MRPFEHPNYQVGFACPICKTSADAPVVLIPKPGTDRDGIAEAVQVHHECYELALRMIERETA